MLSLHCSVGIVERHIGRLCPDIGIGTVIVVSGFALLSIDAVDRNCCGEPFCKVEVTLVLEVELVVEVVDKAAIVIFVVDRKVVAELVGASSQRKVVLLHYTLFVNGVGIVAGIVVFLQRSELFLKLCVCDVAKSFLVEGILYW